jgi:hypothetical protein
VHYQLAIDAVAALHERHFIIWRVHQQDIRLTALPHGYGGAGANRDCLHFVARLLLEERYQDIKETGVLRAGGRRQDDFRIGWRRW